MHLRQTVIISGRAANSFERKGKVTFVGKFRSWISKTNYAKSEDLDVWADASKEIITYVGVLGI